MGVLEDLPNDVLRHILCFLPTKSMAVETRLISTRWRELWNDKRVQHKHGSISVTLSTNLLFGAQFAHHHHWIKERPPRGWRLVFYCPETGVFLVACVGATKRKLHLDFCNGKFPDDISVWWTCLRLMGLCYLDLPYLGAKPTIAAPKVSSKEDRISSLPDKVLQQIICLLPIKSVAKTAIVSTRWYDLQYKGVSKYILNPPLRLVSMRCPCIDYDFDYVWSTFVELMVSYIPRHPPISSIHLTSVNHLAQEEFALILLSSSLVRTIKSLVIVNSQGLSNLNLFGLKSLSHLSICGEEPLNIFHRNKPMTLGYGGRCPFTHIADFHRVRDVMLDFRKGPVTRDVPLKYQLLFILRSIRFAKQITMCRWMFEAMIRKTFYERVEFCNLRELWWIDSSMEEENIDSLITFLGYIPMLEKLFVTVDPTCYRLPSNDNDKGKSGECMHGYLMLASRNERLPHLEMVKMDGFKHEEDEMRLARHMFFFGGSRPSTPTSLVPSVAVPTVRVLATSQRRYPGRLVEISPNLGRSFVYETDISRLDLKHMHMSI